MIKYMIKYYFAIFLGIILTSFSQILLKLGSRNNKSFFKSFFSFRVLFGYLLFIFVIILNIYAMQKIDLKILNALISLNYILVIFLSRLILKENLSSKQLIGTLLITIGLIIYF